MNGQPAGLPLEGIRVVDLSNYIAGPCVAMYLADFGAEVIKCERAPHGDEHRSWGHRKNGIGIHFQMLNRNKKSVHVDLHTPLGVETVKRLVRDADLVIENYRPGTLRSGVSGTTCSAKSSPTSSFCA